MGHGGTAPWSWSTGRSCDSKTPEHPLKNPSFHDGLWKVISQEAHQFCTKFVSHVSLHALDISGFFEAISWEPSSSPSTLFCCCCCGTWDAQSVRWILYKVCHKNRKCFSRVHSQAFFLPWLCWLSLALNELILCRFELGKLMRTTTNLTFGTSKNGEMWCCRWKKSCTTWDA